MSDSQDKIPVWVGRAVTTTDLTADVAGSGPESEEGIVDDEPVVNGDAHQPEEIGRLEIPTKPVAFSIGDIEVDGIEVDDIEVDEDDFDSSRYGSTSMADEALSIAPRDDLPRRSPFGLLAAVLAIALVALAAVAFQAGWLDEDPPAGTRTSSTDSSVVDGDQSDEGLIDQDPSNSAATDNPVPATTAITETDESQATTDDTTAPEDEQSDGMSIPGVPDSSIEAHRLEALSAGESAWAIYTKGKIFLQGLVPSTATGEQISTRLQGLLGAGNVVEQFEVDPSVGEPADPPLFIKETVLFAANGTTMPPGSDWILVVADVLMKRYDNTTLTVIANSGAPVDPGDDVDLPHRRAHTIIDYLVAGGIEADRLDYELRHDVGFGPDTGNEPIEFVVRGLLE